MGDQLAVADQVFQIAYQTELEKDHRVDALTAAVAIMVLGQFIEKIQIYRAFQAPVEIILRYTLAQLEIGEQFLLILLLALHTGSYDRFPDRQ